MPQNRLPIVGAFVIGGLLLFAFGLFRIGDRRMLFTDSFHVHAEFADIAALAGGAKVRVAGMDAGEVEEIRVPAGPSDRFQVRMRVRKDLHPLIRIDSVASIQSDGLVGNKFVQIQTGSDTAPQIEESGTIGSREPFDVADLMQMMSDTIETVNAMLVDVKVNVDEALDVLIATAQDAQRLLNDVGKDVQAILASSRQVSEDVTAIVSSVRQGRGTVGKLMTDEALYDSVRVMAADAEKAVAAIRSASEDARAAIADLRGEEGPVKGMTGEIQQTMHSARVAMGNLVEATEALKRSFLLRGFFNRRGYYNLADVTVAEYRDGVLRARDRRALRIWVDAGVLFERDSGDAERLSQGGRARLDSAMSQFVRYAERNPLVVEGYAQDATADARHLVSSRRATLVRDYLVGKFGLDMRFVTTMAMGQEADGSPAGETWDGVALAVFVPVGEL